MFDNLYENIGGKIKSLAKWLFIIEAVVTVVYGFAIIIKDINLALYGIIIMVGGPIVALILSWILYAFGELVEKISGVEINTKKILNKTNEKSYSSKEELQRKVELAKLKKSELEEKNQKNGKANKIEVEHKWLCNNCKKLRTQSPCEYCGEE